MSETVCASLETPTEIAAARDHLNRMVAERRDWAKPNWDGELTTLAWAIAAAELRQELKGASDAHHPG